MSPWARLVSAIVLAWVFAWTLLPGATGQPAGEADVESWIVSSREAFVAEEWEAALGPTRALVEHFPTQQVYSDRLARIYLQLDKPVEEAAAWEQFVKSAATPEDACPALPQAYARAGDPDASLRAFERCRDFDPLSAEGWFFLGQAYRRAGRDDEALHTFREAVRVDPLHADSRVGLAGALLRSDAPQEALTVIQRAVETNPRYADAHLMHGLTLHRLGRRTEARAALERALAIAGNYVDVHMALGRLDYAEGRTADAHLRFTRALVLDPARREELQVWLDRTREDSR